MKRKFKSTNTFYDSIPQLTIKYHDDSLVPVNENTKKVVVLKIPHSYSNFSMPNFNMPTFGTVGAPSFTMPTFGMPGSLVGMPTNSPSSDSESISATTHSYNLNENGTISVSIPTSSNSDSEFRMKVINIYHWNPQP